MACHLEISTCLLRLDSCPPQVQRSLLYSPLCATLVYAALLTCLPCGSIRSRPARHLLLVRRGLYQTSLAGALPTEIGGLAGVIELYAL